MNVPTRDRETKKRILVVDDEETVREALRTLFAREGYDVWTAPSAEDALALLKDEYFPLIILDLFLPGMDGIEFCQQIRPFLPTAKIYGITGFAIHYDISDCTRAGFDACLEKPVNPRALLEIAASTFK